MSMQGQGEGKTTGRPNVFQVFGSTLAAAFGVQTNKNRERDFQHGNMTTFIIVGLITTIAIIFALYGLVKLLMSIVAG